MNRPMRHRYRYCVRNTARTSLYDFVLAGMIAFVGVPVAYTLRLRVAGIPLLNAFYLCATLLIAVNYIVRFPREHRLSTMYALGGLYMVVVTMLYWDQPAFDWRAAFQDLSAYLGLPVGVAWAQLEGRVGIREAFRKWYVICCVTFALTLLGLGTGFIKSGGGPLRLVDGALFSSTAFVTMSFPTVWSTARLGTALQKAIALAGVGLCATFALVSATRSVAIALGASLWCVAIVKIKRERDSVLWVGALSVLVTAAVVLAYVPARERVKSFGLGERVVATDVRKEDRFKELVMMLEQMGLPEWIHGVGFGTGFKSPISANTERGLAFAPHVGLSALLYKGGAPALLALLLIPCVVAACRLIGSRSSTRDPFLAGATVYFVQSCVSGGWAFFPLFLVGALLQLSLGTRTVFDHRRQWGGFAGPEPLSCERQDGSARVRTRLGNPRGRRLLDAIGGR